MDKGLKKTAARGSPRRSRRRNQAEVPALEALIRETRALCRRLRRTSTQMHQQQGLPQALRGILSLLERQDMQTVPQMARALALSRQHIQTQVNELLQQGLVEQIDNPTHKRSHLIQLSARGRRTLERMTQHESTLLAQLPIEPSTEQLQSAQATLENLRQALEGSRWQVVLAKSKQS